MGSVGDLYHHFLEAVDQAAISSAAWRGLGEKEKADEAAVEAMRRTFDRVPFDGRVAIGEGERDEAPMLYIGEEIGSMVGVAGAPQIDIAVDPLECTNNCASNGTNCLGPQTSINRPHACCPCGSDCSCNKPESDILQSKP